MMSEPSNHSHTFLLAAISIIKHGAFRLAQTQEKPFSTRLSSRQSPRRPPPLLGVTGRLGRDRGVRLYTSRLQVAKVGPQHGVLMLICQSRVACSLDTDRIREKPNTYPPRSGRTIPIATTSTFSNIGWTLPRRLYAPCLESHASSAPSHGDLLGGHAQVREICRV